RGATTKAASFLAAKRATRASCSGSPPPVASRRIKTTAFGQSDQLTVDASGRSWLHGALHTRVDCIKRCRAADVKSISLLTAEAQVGDRFRNVDLAEQIALWSVAAHAVLVRIAPTYGAPNTPLGVTARPVSNAGLGHFREDFAVRHLSGPHIQVDR